MNNSWGFSSQTQSQLQSFSVFLQIQHVAPYFHDDLRLLLMFTRICKELNKRSPESGNIRPRYKTRQTASLSSHLVNIQVETHYHQMFLLLFLHPSAEETFLSEMFIDKFCFLVFGDLPPHCPTLLEITSKKKDTKGHRSHLLDVFDAEMFTCYIFKGALCSFGEEILIRREKS